MQPPQAFRHGQDFIGVLHHANACLAQQVYSHLITTGQRTGMGAGSLLALLGGTGFIHHHRLHGGHVTGHFQKLLPITEALHVERSHASVLVLP